MSNDIFESREPSASPFESRELTTDPLGIRKPAKQAYKGPERRRENRRAGTDRRGNVRFELKDDRRQCAGRREDDAAPKFW